MVDICSPSALTLIPDPRIETLAYSPRTYRVTRTGATVELAIVAYGIAPEVRRIPFTVIPPGMVPVEVTTHKAGPLGSGRHERVIRYIPDEEG